MSSSSSSPFKILGVTHVTVPATAALWPEPVRLSAMDALWVTHPLIQRVLIFDDGCGRPHQPFASLLDSLRASLAATLARFLPLAGKVVFLPSTGDVAIDCSAAGVCGGVRFVAAEWGGADARRLAGDADHDAEAFARLVPALDARELPAEALALQVTRLHGGVALGVAMHHAVADGRSFWSFLQAWASACRGEEAAAEAAPTFDRAAVRLPGGDELARSVLRKYAPNLPVAADMPQYLAKVQTQLSRRTFAVSAQHIRHLKQRIVDMDAGGARWRLAQPLSSFVALAALAWTSHVRSKRDTISPDEDDVYLFFFADCRGPRRLHPRVDERYFGTCIVGCLARAAARDLLAEDGVAAAAAAAQEEVRRAAEDPLARLDWMATASALRLDRVLGVSGSVRFPAYEAADFGWGPPGRTELVTMRRDGQMVVVAGRGGDGVQASVSLHPARMDTFEAHFRSLLE